MRPGKHDLGALRSVPDLHHICPDAVSPAVALAGDLLAGGQNGLGLAQVDEIGPLLVTEHDSVDELAYLVIEFLEDDVSFGLANFLDDDLSRGLGCDPAEALKLDLEGHLAFHLRLGVERLGLFQRDLFLGVRHILNDFLVRVHDDVSPLRIDLHRNALRAVFLLGSAHEGRLDGLDHHLLGNALLLAYLVDDMNEFLTHNHVPPENIFGNNKMIEPRFAGRISHAKGCGYQILFFLKISPQARPLQYRLLEFPRPGPG